MSPSLESELVSNGGWGLARRSPQRPGRRVLFSAALSTAEEVEPGCSGARVPGLVGNPQGAVLFKGHGCSRPGRSLQVSPQPATYAIPSCLTFPAGAGVMRQTRHLHCTLSEFPSHRSCEYSQNGGCFPQVTSGDGHRSWEPGQGTTREISATASFGKSPLEKKGVAEAHPGDIDTGSNHICELVLQDKHAAGSCFIGSLAPRSGCTQQPMSRSAGTLQVIQLTKWEHSSSHHQTGA